MKIPNRKVQEVDPNIIVTFKQLEMYVPYSAVHIRRLEKAGKFPKRIRLGPNRVGFYLHQVLEWQRRRNNDQCQLAELGHTSEQNNH
jgi:prophage regulatory protein